MLNTLESAVKNKDASDRVKAANLMSLAAQGYNLNELTFDPSKWQMSQNPMDEGYLFRVESGAGFSQSDRTTTKATLSEGKILLNKESTPTEITAAQLGINTDITQANAQTETPKDINKTLNEQQQIAQAVGHVKSAVENYVKNQRKAAEADIAELEKQQAEAKAKGDTAQVNKLESQLDTAKQRKEDWGTSGANKRIADTVTGILTTALAGAPTEALATTAVSPLVNQAIKKATTNEKGEVDKIPNAIAHAVWGAIEAASMKGNATAGAVAAASSELAAPLIAEALYGTADPKVLTEEQKQNIVKLSSLAGAIGAGVVENETGVETLTSANQGGEIGKWSVENNYAMAIVRGGTLICSRSCIQAIEAGLGISLGVALTTDDKEEAFLAGMSRDPEKIGKLNKEQIDYLNSQILDKGLLFDNSRMLGSDVWIPNADGGYTPIDPSLVTTTYGGKPAIDPRIFVNHTGGVEYPADYNLPTHTGGSQTVTNDKDCHILAGGESQIGDWKDNVLARDNRLPIPEPVKAGNGLTIESNSKHTPGGAGNRPDAGIEPKNSLELLKSQLWVEKNVMP